jgi:hypothetical protein
MDTRYFVATLLALGEGQARQRLSTKAEDAYYERHAPRESRMPRIASLAAAVALGFVSIGLWLK